MRRQKENGNAIVEFAAVFPLFVLLSLSFLDLSVAGVRYMALASASHALARELALSSLTDPQAMRGEACAWLRRRFKQEIFLDLRVRSLPTLPRNNPYRREKEIQIIHLTLVQHHNPVFPLMRWLAADSPFAMSCHAREVKVAHS